MEYSAALVKTPSGNVQKPLEVYENEKKTLINNLPPEMLAEIFSHLDMSSAFSLTEVSKFWNATTICHVKLKKTNAINKSIRFIIKYLTENNKNRLLRQIKEIKYSKIIKELEKFLISTPVLESTSILQVEERMEDVRKLLASILKNVDLIDLYDLKELFNNYNKPYSLTNLIQTAILYKNIEILMATDETSELIKIDKYKNLSNFSLQLFLFGDINLKEVIELTNKIPKCYCIDIQFLEHTKILAFNNRYKDAIHIAKFISDNSSSMNEEASLAISNALSGIDEVL